MEPIFNELTDESNKKHAGHFVNRCLNTQDFFWLFLALLVNGALIFYTTQVTLRAFPLSPDEYAYQISADLFAQGKLSIPSPEPREFFDSLSIINNGAYYGKYPPGWPLLLAIGSQLNLTWWVNPVLGLLTLILLFALARTLFSPIVANITMILTLFCPYFIFNSACLLSHPSGLLFLTLAVFSLLASEDNLISFIGFGMTSGFAFLIRPYTTVLVLAPLVFYVLAPALFQRKFTYLRNFFFGAIPPFSFFLALFLLYDYAQTGHPTIQPFELYNPYDHLGFYQNTWAEFIDRFNMKVVKRSWDWICWTGGLPLLVLFLWYRGKRQETNYFKASLLALPAVFLLVGYFFYVGSGIYQYGPRYLYESYSLLLIPAALGVIDTKRWAPLVLAVCLVLNMAKFFGETPAYQKLADDHIKFFEIVRRLSNAIVFVQAKEDPEYFTRNGLDFNGPVLLVLDRGADKNEELMMKYPNRSYYLYSPETPDWEHLLKPYDKKSAKNVSGK